MLSETNRIKEWKDPLEEAKIGQFVAATCLFIALTAPFLRDQSVLQYRSTSPHKAATSDECWQGWGLQGKQLRYIIIIFFKECPRGNEWVWLLRGSRRKSTRDSLLKLMSDQFSRWAGNSLCWMARCYVNHPVLFCNIICWDDSGLLVVGFSSSSCYQSPDIPRSHCSPQRTACAVLNGTSHWEKC